MAMRDQEIKVRREEAQTYLDGWKGEFREKGIEAQALLFQGPVVQAITDAAEKKDADLIAIASHGRSGLSQCFYGSVASGVLNRVDRPLLVVRSLRKD